MLHLYFTYPAHIVIENINEFYNGLLHPFLVPAHILAMVITGIQSGQSPAHTLLISRAFMGFIVAAAMAVALGCRIPASSFLLVAVLISSIFCAAIVHHPKMVSIGLAVITGLLLGFDSIFESSQSTQAAVLFALGCSVSAGFVSFYIALLVRKATKQWQYIGVRIIASWAGAISLMMLALQLANK